jgi:hypothetical protein
MHLGLPWAGTEQQKVSEGFKNINDEDCNRTVQIIRAQVQKQSPK